MALAEQRMAHAAAHGPHRLAPRRWFFVSILGVAAFAWACLWLWSQSPYGRYLHRGDWTHSGFAAQLCAALPAGEVLLPALLFVGGWVLMLAAMMLPTTLPLLEIWRRLTQDRADRTLLLALVVAGYFLAWLGFAAAAHLADFALFAAVRGSDWLTFNGWAIGAAVLGLAGAFQFSALKYRCLAACHMPLPLVMRHWRGGDARVQALRLGVHHGVLCVGCCWALMLLMFVVGTGNLGWMLALGAVMAAEKNLPQGRRLSTPLGAGLLAGAAMIAAAHLGVAAS